MINLEKSSLVGKGYHRECYRHPEDGNLCIKVVVHGNSDEVRREKKYYQHLKKRGISWDMLPRYHGEIETNLGTGDIFDLISDSNGDVSKTLEYYLSSKTRFEAHIESLSSALCELKKYLLRQRIITMTIKSKNIACQEIGHKRFRLYVIDNIGNSDFIPICTYNKWFAEKKILRKWEAFQNAIDDAHKHTKQ